MLKHLSLCGTLFDLIVATPKAGGAIYDLSESPDALLVHLAGGKLALGFERPDTMLKALEALQAPGCTFVDSTRLSRCTSRRRLNSPDAFCRTIGRIAWRPYTCRRPAPPPMGVRGPLDHSEWRRG
jgi:hypothetical protein